MGLFVSKIVNRWFGNRQARIVMVGLDAAGKTTLLHYMSFNEPCYSTVPTIGFTFQTVKVGRLVMSCFDLGGQQDLRHLWQHYFKGGCDGLIFVVDASDHAITRKSEARTVFEQILTSDELIGVPVLIFSNKHDIAGAMKQTEVAEMLGLNELHGREWKVFDTCGFTGLGVADGMKWLSGAVKDRWSTMTAEERKAAEEKQNANSN